MSNTLNYCINQDWESFGSPFSYGVNMKVKFIGNPNMLVKERKRKPMSTEFIFKPIFRFDSNGEYVTEDERLITKLKKKFKYEIVNEYVDFEILWWFEENEENYVIDNDRGEDIKKYQCKKCGESFDNWGFYMSHCRQEHPKEG
jgi:hypothetical protein